VDVPEGISLIPKSRAGRRVDLQGSRGEAGRGDPERRYSATTVTRDPEAGAGARWVYPNAEMEVIRCRNVPLR
jgi:hypothetical protein